MPIDTPEILIVENETQVRQDIVGLFGSLGYETFTAASVTQAARRVRQPDLIVLDLAALGLDDVQSILSFREIFHDAPIFATSRRRDASIKIAALDAGADDFLSKPFDLKEFAARARAMLRRRPPKQETRPQTCVGEFEFDVEKRSVTIGHRTIVLSRKEFSLLQIFAQHADEVLTHGFLASQLWDEQMDIHYVRVYVSQIRSKIEIDPTNPEYLITHSGMGYLFRCKRRDVSAIAAAASLDLLG